MNSYISMKMNFSSQMSNFKYSFIDGISRNKKTCFFLFIVALIGILTGVFTAINYCNGATLVSFSNFSLNKFLSGQLGTLELFFSRFVSNLCVVGIVTVTSISVYIIPINFFLIAYRGYLLSLNVSIMVILYGVGGILTGLLVVLPCQLIALFIIGVYICISNSRAYSKKCYGTPQGKLFSKLIIVLIALALIDLIETLLLLLFSSRVILVI